MVGTGASLLHRKARGAVEGVEGPDKNTPQEDYDFQSNLAEFDKTEQTEGYDLNKDKRDSVADDENMNGEGRYGGSGSVVYQKDDFFDSISSDVLDKRDSV